HFSFAILFFLMVMLFKWMNNKSIIGLILKVAGFTYGPLLGLFAFGRLTNRSINDRSEEHTSELQSRFDLVCRLLLEKKNKNKYNFPPSTRNTHKRDFRRSPVIFISPHSILQSFTTKKLEILKYPYAAAAPHIRLLSP